MVQAMPPLALAWHLTYLGALREREKEISLGYRSPTYLWRLNTLKYFVVGKNRKSTWQRISWATLPCAFLHFVTDLHIPKYIQRANS